MNNDSPNPVARLASKAFIVLVVRQIIAQSINITGGIIIARLLGPTELGIFGILTFMVIFGQTLSDFGLGYTLIQQDHNPSPEDYSKAFTFQICVIAAIVSILWIFSNQIATYYHLSSNGPLLIKIISLGLFPQSLQSLYTASLERFIAFKHIAYIEIFQSFMYNAISILLAFLHCGVWSLIAAFLIRTITGAGLILFVKGIIPGFIFDWNFILKRLPKGLFIQGSNLVSQAKDAIVPLYIGAALGPQSVGFINWAGMLAFYPVIILNVLNRIYLPSFSRLKNEPAELRNYFSFIIGWSNRIALPLVAVVYCNAELIAQVVFGSKWLPAVPMVKLFCLSNAFVASSGPCLSLLNALGKPRIPFFFTTLWFMLTWLIGVPMTTKWGALGFSAATIMVSSSAIVLFIICSSQLKVNLIKPIFKPLLFSLLTGVILSFAAVTFDEISILNLLVKGFSGVIFFGLLTLVFDKQVRSDFRYIITPAIKYV